MQDYHSFTGQCYIVRIELKNLKRKNHNQEYQKLYEELEVSDFRIYCSSSNKKFELPAGIYSLPTDKADSLKIACEMAQKAIHNALKGCKYPYKDDAIESRYSIFVCGPTNISGLNLDDYVPD